MPGSVTDRELGPLPEPVPESNLAVFDGESIPF
jgi:hypothetical protein